MNNKLRTRFHAVKNGEWLALLADLLEGDSPSYTANRIKSDNVVAKRVLSLAREGSWRKAISALRSTGAPDRSLAAWGKLSSELPDAVSHCPADSGPISMIEEELKHLRGRILQRIRQADGAASSGLLGSGANMWKLLVRQDGIELTDLVVNVFQRIALGDIPQGVKDILMHSDLLAGPRPDGRVRPIEVPSFIRKIAIGALMDVLAPESDSAAGPSQFGLRTADGAVSAFSVLEHATALDPTLVVASVDVKGAHANIRRDVLETICEQEAPRLAQLLRIWYHCGSPKTWRGNQTKTKTSATGVGQGFPEAGPLFCSGLGRCINKLQVQVPGSKAVAFQDDTYIIGSAGQVEAALQAVPAIWGELGLEVNETKLKLYSQDPSVRSLMSEGLRTKFVDTLGVLGQRLALRLEEEGVEMTLSSSSGGLSLSLDIAHGQLTRLSKRLREIAAAGLPLSVAHKIWVVASSGAITHLQAANYCNPTTMGKFQALQRDHLEWMTGRRPSERDLAIALLPLNAGGLGLPDHVLAAPRIFLSSQCRVLPATCKTLDIPSVEDLISRRLDLHQRLQAATAQAVEKGAVLRKVPQPSSATDSRMIEAKGRACTKAMQKAAREEIEGQLRSSQRGRLRGQGRRGASLWLQEPLPEGEAPANATWQGMARLRVLMPGPGAPIAPSETSQCGHRSQQGRRCAGSVDDDGIHETLCNMGGGPDIRHNRAREWLAEKLKESFGGRTLQEQAHPLANLREMGRMDLKHDSASGHLDIDVTITSIYTSNVREALRRESAPERSIRCGVADKLKRYGPGVIAFAADDTGAIGAGALRLLRKMAVQSVGECLAPKLFTQWRAELQHIILQATVGMAQAARGVPRTA